jgi:hypothetical protein
MDGTYLIEIASLLFSVFAFAFATIFGWRTTMNEKHIQEFEIKERKEKEEEKKKALIDAKAYKLDAYSCSINIFNRGLATAHNIRFVYPDITDEDKSGIIPDMDNIQMPYPFLHTGGSFDIRTLLAEGHKPISIVRFIWDDDYANNNERELVLNF